MMTIINIQYVGNHFNADQSVQLNSPGIRLKINKYLGAGFVENVIKQLKNVDPERDRPTWVHNIPNA